MFKQIVIFLSLVVFILGAASGIHAQGVLMNSPETIDPGNFKLGIFPTVLLRKGGVDPAWGVAARAGLGITRRLDIEAKGAIFKDLTYFGLDLEFWFIKGRNINASLAVGGHMTQLETGSDSYGIDGTLQIGTTPLRNLEIYIGFVAAFDTLRDSDQTLTRMHLVPGLEYRISENIDFLAEFGFSLNDDSRSHISAGLAYYFR